MFRSFPHVAETESSINKWFTIYVVEASLQVTIANNMQQQLFCGTGCIRNTIRGRWNIRNSDWEWVSFLKQIRRAANMGTEISTDTSTLGKQNVSKSAKGDFFIHVTGMLSVSVFCLWMVCINIAYTLQRGAIISGAIGKNTRRNHDRFTQSKGWFFRINATLMATKLPKKSSTFQYRY